MKSVIVYVSKYTPLLRCRLSVLAQRCSSSHSADSPALNAPTLVQHRKPKAVGFVVDGFLDNRRVQVVGGNGGDGCIAFLREMYNPLGGPSGGDGGHGGHIVLVADESISSLTNVSSIIRGEHGRHGKGDHCHGKCAEHTFVRVPVGTAVYQVETEPTTGSMEANQARSAELKDKYGLTHKVERLRKLTELTTSEQRFVAARGGAGGRGNAFFLSNEQRAPTIAQRGARGESRTLHLEMTLVAHAGLVGVPNAGKSSLLAALTRARPKIAPYAFTTLSANVGVLDFDDSTQLRLADLPGLVADSHENRGLGYAFLRHVRKCVCLLFVLDASGQPEIERRESTLYAQKEQESGQNEIHQVRLTPFEQYETLRNELLHFDASLLSRPHAFLFNKSDVFTSPAQLDRAVQLFTCQYAHKYGALLGKVICVSAKTSHNVREAAILLRSLYDSSDANAERE